jgi:alpha-glucosidase (family GH31 glycosyl hydrolase)
MRYDLIHYLYTCFVEATKTGIPIMRPMFIEYPQDEVFFDMATQFMFCDSILSSPKITPYEYDATLKSYGTKVVTTLPLKDSLYNFETKLLENRTSPIT